MKLNERTLLKSMNFSEAQKTVLSKIIGSSTPRTAGSEITTDRKLIVARDTLAKLGLIVIDESTGDLSITNAGNSAMIDAGLIDASGNLTDSGKKYASVGSASPSTNKEVTQSFESFSLLKEINDLAKNN